MNGYNGHDSNPHDASLQGTGILAYLVYSEVRSPGNARGVAHLYRTDQVAPGICHEEGMGVDRIEDLDRIVVGGSF